METNYRVAYKKYWQDLKRKLPEEITSNLAVRYYSNTHQFALTFFNAEYVLDCSTENIFKSSDGNQPEIIASIIMLNYLVYARPPMETARRWISLKEIPNGGMLFYPAFYKNSIGCIIDFFGHNSKEFLASAKALGGQPASSGDASFIFQAFPEIPICVIVWEGDSEVTANATILFKPSIVPMLHVESIIGLGMYLSSELIRLAGKR